MTEGRGLPPGPIFLKEAKVEPISVQGLALKLHRTAAGFSREELGAKISRSASWIQTVENQKATVIVTDLDLWRLAVALGIKTEDLEK